MAVGLADNRDDLADSPYPTREEAAIAMNPKHPDRADDRPDDRYPHLPADPDVTADDTGPPGGRARLIAGRADVLTVIAAGGALGSLARWGVSLALPHLVGATPWSTVAVNIVGSALLGVLIVVLSEQWPDHRYARPFLGVGVLGGFTTFSTFVLDAHDLAVGGHLTGAAAYLVVTLVGGLLAVWAATVATEAILSRGRPV